MLDRFSDERVPDPTGDQADDGKTQKHREWSGQPHHLEGISEKRAQSRKEYNESGVSDKPAHCQGYGIPSHSGDLFPNLGLGKFYFLLDQCFGLIFEIPKKAKE